MSSPADTATRHLFLSQAYTALKLPEVKVAGKIGVALLDAKKNRRHLETLADEERVNRYCPND